MPRQLIPGALIALAAAGALAACTTKGTAIPVQVQQAAPTTIAAAATPSQQTVYVQPPPTHTVYVQPPPSGTAASGQWYAQAAWIDAQPWITITPGPGQTDCQWLYANGYSYAEAFAAWAQNGYPANWSATNDGYPCQRSYGMQH